MEWTKCNPPPISDLADHDVPKKGNHLEGKRIALLVTGSVAAMNSPSIARELRKYGADVQAFVSEAALKYGVNKCALEWATYPNKVIVELTAASEHLSYEKPFDLYLVAPATANTICKVAAGISDTVVTSALASALGRTQHYARVMMAPAMHGSLNTPIFRKAISELKSHCVHFIAPYDAYGKHNLADKKVIAMDVCRMLSDSVLKEGNLYGHEHKRILVTAGPTPTKIDSVRRLTNRFSGKLGILIAEELYRAGADVMLFQAASGIRPPDYLPYTLFDDYDDYYAKLTDNYKFAGYDWGIFSAAVADYKPAKFVKGKIPSGGKLKSIELVPTEKVIDCVREKFPKMNMITFKYEEDKSVEQMVSIASDRIANKNHKAVVINNGNETGKDGEQSARIVYNHKGTNSITFTDQIIGKEKIAKAIRLLIEDMEEKPSEKGKQNDSEGSNKKE